jgi:hypothetical protein
MDSQHEKAINLSYSKWEAYDMLKCDSNRKVAKPCVKRNGSR